uniref:Putative secreted protein n=1 Tax=Anopheles marajoara TaxID=58244 RepID=A0A2M4CFP9_9DIPT
MLILLRGLLLRSLVFTGCARELWVMISPKDLLPSCPIHIFKFVCISRCPLYVYICFHLYINLFAGE